MFVGHRRVVDYLAATTLPRCVLLIGPDSIGKRTLGLEIARWNQVQGIDICSVEAPRVPDVRALQAWAAEVPQGPYRLALVDLDGGSAQAQQELVRALDVIPTHFRAVLRSSPKTKIFPILYATALRFSMSLLTDPEIEQILLQRGTLPREAKRLAQNARGQVNRAITPKLLTSSPNDIALRLIRAIAARNSEQFQLALQDVNEDVVKWLRIWSLEANTGEWKYFKAVHRFGLPHSKLSLLMVKLQREAEPKSLLNGIWRDLVTG